MTTEEIKLLNYLNNPKPQIKVSVNERSFKIFGNEKFLTSNVGIKLLHKYKVNDFVLNVYRTPEPFMYYLYPYNNSKDALIIENKDTWFTIRKILMEYGEVFGISFKAIIYGEGRKIQKSFLYMKEPDTKELQEIQNFYYFGDIDSSGIDIFYKLKKRYYPEFLIFPFEEGYKYLMKHQKLKRFKELKKQIKLPMYKCLNFIFLNDKDFSDMYHLCNDGYIIPQEIISYEYLRRIQEIKNMDFDLIESD